MKAYQFREHGGPEVLQWNEISLPAPGAGEVRIRHHASDPAALPNPFRQDRDVGQMLPRRDPIEDGAVPNPDAGKIVPASRPEGYNPLRAKQL